MQEKIKAKKVTKKISNRTRGEEDRRVYRKQIRKSKRLVPQARAMKYLPSELVTRRLDIYTGKTERN